MIVKNVEKKEKSTVSFDVLCDAAEFEKAINAAYLKNKKNIFVQGFRKGKAPRMVIEGMYGKDVFYEEATDQIAPEAFQFAVEQESLRTIGTPSVTNVDVSDAKELTLSFQVAVWPEVTLGQYRGIEAPRAKGEVTDEMVEDELGRIQRRNARIATAERPAKDGDTAIIDYAGTVDGVPFEGGSDQGHGLVLGCGTFIPGFEEQVIGMNPGEEKDITVTFPEDYRAEELAGKEAVFHVKVNELKEEILPELDDEFAKDVSEFDTLDEYRASIRARMETVEKDNAESAFQNALIEKASDAITAEIPDAMVEDHIDNMVREYEQNMQASGLNLQTYLQYMGQDMASFRASMRPMAERRAKTELLLETIAEVENIEVTPEEIAEEYEKAAENYQVDLEIVKGGVPESAIVGDIKARKAAQIIFDTGVATEPVAEEPAAEAATAEEKKPAKKTTRKKKTETATAEGAAEDAPAAEKKPAKKTPRKKKTEEAPVEEAPAESAE